MGADNYAIITVLIADQNSKINLFEISKHFFQFKLGNLGIGLIPLSI